MINDIFPDLGGWNELIDNLLKNKFPPTQTSYHLTQEAIERHINLDFSKTPIWTLICEEAVDTEYSHIYYTKAYETVIERGISEEEYKKARKFMWLTAGWFNFEKMLWDWVELSEEDIKIAINMQEANKLISKTMKTNMLKYVDYIKSFDE